MQLRECMTSDCDQLAILFVHKNHQHKGIASAICDELEYSARGKKITTIHLLLPEHSLNIEVIELSVNKQLLEREYH